MLSLTAAEVQKAQFDVPPRGRRIRPGRDARRLHHAGDRQRADVPGPRGGGRPRGLDHRSALRAVSTTAATIGGVDRASWRPGRARSTAECRAAFDGTGCRARRTAASRRRWPIRRSRIAGPWRRCTTRRQLQGHQPAVPHVGLTHGGRRALAGARRAHARGAARCGLLRRRRSPASSPRAARPDRNVRGAALNRWRRAGHRRRTAPRCARRDGASRRAGAAAPCRTRSAARPLSARCPAGCASCPSPRAARSAPARRCR